MHYEPSYIRSLLNIKLSPELKSIVEMLAEKVHDRWADERMKSGWIYGNNRNDQFKTTPNLVPYTQLPEHEKEIDRATVDTVIKLLISAGYRIVKNTSDE